jgi:DNA-binding LytR/AlgR family response regulator
VNDSPLQLALREMRAQLTSRLTRMGVVVAIALLAISGPFGTFEAFGLGQRVLYWAAVVLPTYLVGQGAVTFVSETLRRRGLARWPRLLLSAIAAAVPIGAVVVVVNALFFRHASLGDVLSIWLYVAVITVVVVVVFASLRERRQAAVAALPPAAADTAPRPPPILERVPLPQRGRLLALSVEDHYVDIITDKGKALVLMRLADAMRETGDVAGLQIHRSHWVATDAVAKTHRSSGRTELELKNGLRLPVSRGFLPEVRAAGLA